MVDYAISSDKIIFLTDRLNEFHKEDEGQSQSITNTLAHRIKAEVLLNYPDDTKPDVLMLDYSEIMNQIRAQYYPKFLRKKMNRAFLDTPRAVEGLQAQEFAWDPLYGGPEYEQTVLFNHYNEKYWNGLAAMDDSPTLEHEYTSAMQDAFHGDALAFRTGIALIAKTNFHIRMSQWTRTENVWIKKSVPTGLPTVHVVFNELADRYAQYETQRVFKPESLKAQDYQRWMQ